MNSSLKFLSPRTIVGLPLPGSAALALAVVFAVVLAVVDGLLFELEPQALISATQPSAVINAARRRARGGLAPGGAAGDLLLCIKSSSSRLAVFQSWVCAARLAAQPLAGAHAHPRPGSGRTVRPSRSRRASFERKPHATAQPARRQQGLAERQQRFDAEGKDQDHDRGSDH